MILTLDVATRTGWAAGEPGTTPAFGSRGFGGAGIDTGEVLGVFRAWLNARCDQFKPDIMVFERPYIARPSTKPGARSFQMNAYVVERLYSLCGIVQATCWERRIDCYAATVAEVSKFFVGRVKFGGDRAAKKQATIDACRLYGWDVGTDDDAGDALALWAMTECKIDPRAHSRRGGEGPLFLGRKEASLADTSEAFGGNAHLRGYKNGVTSHSVRRNNDKPENNSGKRRAQLAL